MMNTEIKHVMADTANGIQIIDYDFQPTVNWLIFDDFLSQLPTLQDDELLFSAVNAEQLAQLENEYGVTK